MKKAFKNIKKKVTKKDGGSRAPSPATSHTSGSGLGAASSVSTPALNQQAPGPSSRHRDSVASLFSAGSSSKRRSSSVVSLGSGAGGSNTDKPSGSASKVQ